jgi:hypothetical protein
MAEFRASASGHGSGASAIDQLGDHATDMWNAFKNGIAQYNGWWGHDDEFAGNALANWNLTYGNVVDAGDAIFGAIQGAAQATQDNAAMLVAAQTESASVVQSASTHH